MKKGKRILAFLLSLCLALPMGASLALAEGKPAAASWTVLIYLCGTDLESNHGMATVNLEEIAQTRANDNVQVVIQTGGTKEWKAQGLGLDIATDRLQRYSYNEKGFELVDEQPLANMASASTLTSFVNWGVEHYPAEKYMLVLWDHGGGSNGGLIVDELHNRAIMPLEQLQLSLERTGVQLEAILLDTCLMASLETAQALQNVTNYLIASEEVVPGAGTNFKGWLQYLYDMPSCNGERLGREICDTVQQKYADRGEDVSGQMLTFSVIDLSKLDAVTAAFNQMFLELTDMLQAPEKVAAFGFYTQHTQRFYAEEMVDLASLAASLRQICLSDETALAVSEAVSSAVPYAVKGGHRTHASGLSFCYLANASVQALDHYARNSNNPAYLAFLDAASMTWTAPEWVYEKTARADDISYHDYVVQTELGLSEEGLPQLAITNAPNAVSLVDTVLFQRDTEAQNWTLLGSCERGIAAMDDRYIASFTGLWPYINNVPCSVTLVEEGLNYALYQMPFRVELNGSSDDLWLRFAYLYDQSITETTFENPMDALDLSAYAGHYEAYGLWNTQNDSVDLPDRNILSIKELSGATFAPLYTHYDSVTDDTGLAVPGESFEMPNLPTIDLQTLPAGKYAIAFKVTDCFGNTSYTDGVQVTWDGEKASYILPMSNEQMVAAVTALQNGETLDDETIAQLCAALEVDDLNELISSLTEAAEDEASDNQESTEETAESAAPAETAEPVATEQPAA